MKKIAIVLATIGLLSVASSGTASAAPYWVCRKGLHSVGTTSPTYSLYLAAIGYYCYNANATCC